MSWRDLLCGEVRSDRVGERLKLAGWAARRRDHGGLIFIDLRDRSGICQLVVNPERAPAAAEAAHQVRNEFVVQAVGEVVRRAPEAVNPNLPTGEVELQVDSLEIISRSDPLPFQLDEENVDEATRLRYRYLDVELEFAEREDVLEVLEGAVVASFEALDREPPVRPFRRASWHEAMRRYGSDKPDLRFGLELEEATERTRDSEFKVFSGAPCVRFLRVPQELSR